MISAWNAGHANDSLRTLEDAEHLQLVVDIGLLLLEVNRTCTLLNQFAPTERN
jgi:hypothetical protein